MRTSNVYPALTRLATATCIQEPSKDLSFTSFIALSHGFDTSLNDDLSKEVFPCEYVAARATTCPIFQCFVCLCEASLSNYKPIMHFKHSYMHNHAFYVLIHPIILLCHTYMLHILSNSIQFPISNQFQFQFQSKLQLSNSISISILIPTVKSNSNCQIQIQLSNSMQSPITISNQSNCQIRCNLQSQFQFNVKFEAISISMSNVNVNIQSQCQCQFQFSIQFQSNLNVNCNSPIQCLCLCSISTFNLSFNFNFQFNSNQCQFHSQFTLGPTKMVMSIFKSSQ
jgi:hypothetical protein